jgi:hypothetical protein
MINIVKLTRRALKAAICLLLLSLLLTRPGLAAGPPPTITVQPLSQSVQVLGSVTFTVSASSGTTMSYQWRKNGSSISGATQSAYTISPVQTTDAATYTVKVSNAGGSVTSSGATLTVLIPPAITTQPQSQAMAVGGNVTFSLVASGTAPLGYQWSFNGTAVSGATSSALTLTNVQTNSAGSYSVVVTNSVGSVVSSNAALAVGIPPAITTQPQSQVVTKGDDVSFSVVASGTTPLGYHWSRNGTAVSGSTNSSLSFANIQTSSAGSYTVVVTNFVGSVTSAVAALTVATSPVFLTQPQDLMVVQGQTASFHVDMAGTTQMYYTWYLNGSSVASAWSGSSSTLWLSNVQASAAGSVYVTTLNIYNLLSPVASATATLTVLVPPAIQTQPTDLTVMQGLTAVLSVGASGTAPLGYQWSLNGTNISGATNASLAWSNVQPAQVGDYSVVITNSAGSVTSAVATLSMIAVQPGSYVEAVITNRPLAYWRLDDPSGTTAFDYVGGNDATYANVTLNQPGALATDGDPAAGFNGTSAYAGTGVSLVNNLAAFTLEGWYKLVAGGTRMGFWGQNNAIEFGLSDAKTIQIYTAGGGMLNVTNTWGTNSWHHLAAVGNGANLLLYVDGSLAGSGGSATANYGSSTYPFNIGGGGVFDATTNWFNGCLDEVAVYSRALPAKDIKRHYLLGLALPALTLTAPTNNAIFTAPATITLAANVVTNGHTITNVQFFNGTTLLNTRPASPYTYSWGGVGAGTYNVSAVVNYDLGSVTSSVATVAAYVAPGIQTQPQSLMVTQGQSAPFSVVANGSAPFSYQWNLNGSPLSGSTDASLTLASAQVTDAGSYTVVVANLVGSVTSAVATLTIAVPPIITNQPQSQAVSTHDATSFSVSASGTAPLRYQWNLNGASLSGATSSTLALNNIKSQDGGSYTVVVTNYAGSVTSAVAVLTVDAPPFIITQPQSQTAILGQSASIPVVAIGVAPVTYQWRLNGSTVAGATNSNLTLTGIRTNDAGSYTVVLTNSFGSVTSVVATLAVNVPAEITTQPLSQVVTQGQNTLFSVVATGTGPLSYQWSINGTGVAGATASTLALTNVQTADAGSYSLVVTNSWGAATSSVAALTVLVPPTIATQPQAQTLTAGQSATFFVTANGTAPLSYQWNLNGSDLPGATTSVLTLNNLQATDAGGYTVVVTNSAGSVTSAVAALTVNLPPGITTQPLSQMTTQAQSASFSVVATGTGQLNYQWSLNGSDLPGATASTLVLTNVQTTDAGSYTVVVTNSWGSVTSELAALTVLVPPTIATQPQAQTVMAGQSATFSVTASGTAPLNYQWNFSGTNLAGATTSVLTLTNLQATDAGSYTVVVTNSAGSITSAAALLTVTNPPPPRLDAAGMTTNGFAFQMSVSAGQTYVILATANLQDWTPISTNVALTGNVLVTDTDATNFGKRFYRVELR